MEQRSTEFLNTSIGMLSFPHDFPDGMHLIVSINSSSEKGFVSMSFSSVVNFGRSTLERYASISCSEQVSLFLKIFFKCFAAIDHISLCTLVELPLVSLRKGIALETDLDHCFCERVEDGMNCAIFDLVSGLG